jgi:hypothetical protein
MSDQPDDATITFRCPPELEAILPRPQPAVSGLPDWFKVMPSSAFSDILQIEQMTVKKCPPFIDAMTYGFLIPLVTDLHVEDGAFSWKFDAPRNAIASYSRSPIDFHDSSQVQGTPWFEDDLFLMKFNNFWTIESPPGISLLITHPINRHDLPFTTLTGLVDCDLYKDNFINFPRDGTIRASAACCPRERPSPNAYRSGAKSGPRDLRPSVARPSTGCSGLRPPSPASRASTDSNFGLRSAEAAVAQVPLKVLRSAPR